MLAKAMSLDPANQQELAAMMAEAERRAPLHFLFIFLCVFFLMLRGVLTAIA